MLPPRGVGATLGDAARQRAVSLLRPRRCGGRRNVPTGRRVRTYSPKGHEVDRDWYVVDARDQVLGRLASRVAHVLRGKHKPIFAPHVDVGDYVIVVNAAEVRLTGDKAEKKIWHRHSGFPGGLKSVPFTRLLDETPEKAVGNAIRGMLPKNRLGRQMARKLKVYGGPNHPHAAQQPKPFPDVL